MTLAASYSLDGPSSNVTPVMSSKKRKASELHDEPNLNGHGHPPSARKSSTRKPVSYVNRSAGDPVVFDIQCPAKPGNEASDKAKDLFRGKDDPDLPDLAIDFTVKPGSKWANIRAYRNVKLMDQTFTTGQIIFVNRKMPAPSPPPEGAPESEVLQYDKANMWVGKIIQAKAESDKAVFLRVFWLYWPEELPMGRQPYHGERELIMSNAMDIIDAQTIACAAEVSHWDEEDDEHDGKQKERFWRQTLDITKLGPKNKGGLSSVRTHCICNTEYNPDRTMYKCLKEDCGIWNHEECLMKDVLQHAYERLETGTLESGMDKHVAALATQQDRGKTLGERLMSPAEAIGQMVKKRVMHAIEAAVEEVKHESTVELHSVPTAAETPKKASRQKPADLKPGDGKLDAYIDISDAENGLGTVHATIKLLPAGKGKNKTEARQWTVKLNCLKCHKPLD